MGSTTPDSALELAKACGRGDEAAVKILLSRGVDPNAKTNWGTTPLQHAEISGRYAHIVQMLIDAGAVKKHVEPWPVRKCDLDLDELLDTSLDHYFH